MEFSWSRLEDDVYSMILDCYLSAEKLRIKIRKGRLCSSPPTRSLDAVSNYILGFLRKRKAGNEFILVVTDSFSKIRKGTLFTTIFINHSVSELERLSKVLNNNGPQFTSIFSPRRGAGGTCHNYQASLPDRWTSWTIRCHNLLTTPPLRYRE